MWKNNVSFTVNDFPRIPCVEFQMLCFSHRLCTLGLYVTPNVVELMFIALFQFRVCYHDGV